MSSSQLVWLITGTSSGFGRDLALAALRRGDKVIATTRARSFQTLASLKDQGADVLELDVTSSLETLNRIAEDAIKIHGRVDVLVNNAGYITIGALEQCTLQETIDQYNTNVFGALNVSRAFLPYMRAKKSGTIVFSGSASGWVAAPGAGLYATSKFAIRGISKTLHAEISPLGLRSICFEAGFFRTDFLTTDHRAPYIPRITDYKEMTEKTDAALLAYSGKQPGDPKKAVEVILDVVRGEGVARGKEFTSLVSLGNDGYTIIKNSCENTLRGLEEWKEVSTSTDFMVS